jgi:hypothetical protein
MPEADSETNSEVRLKILQSNRGNYFQRCYARYRVYRTAEGNLPTQLFSWPYTIIRAFFPDPGLNPRASRTESTAPEHFQDESPRAA